MVEPDAGRLENVIRLVRFVEVVFAHDKILYDAVAGKLLHFRENRLAGRGISAAAVRRCDVFNALLTQKMNERHVADADARNENLLVFEALYKGGRVAEFLFFFTGV